MTSSKSKIVSGASQRMWPVFLLLVAAVIVPTLGILWFMSAAVKNERAAVRKRVEDFYRAMVQKDADRIDRYWKNVQDTLEEIATLKNPEEILDKTNDSPDIPELDSFILFDEEGETLFPRPVPRKAPVLDSYSWQEARKLEFLESKHSKALEVYEDIYLEAGQPDEKAWALLGYSRCLSKSGRTDDAVATLTQTLNDEKYLTARNPEGRLIVPDALLMALNIMSDPSSRLYVKTVERLYTLLTDLSLSIPSAQRLFLLLEIKTLVQGHSGRFHVDPKIIDRFILLEDLALKYAGSNLYLPEKTGLSQTGVPGVWQMAAGEENLLTLFQIKKIKTLTRDMISAPLEEAELTLRIIEPGADIPRANQFLNIPAGPSLRGWHFSLYMNKEDAFSLLKTRQIQTYAWIATLIILFIVFTSAAAGRYLARQVRLARLKNDMIATVSHELKTPLSSMRVLVDTMLEGRYEDMNQVREYLELISGENQRLSHLIDNFLSFSRMERNKKAFDLDLVSPIEIAEDAKAAVREKYSASGAKLELDVDHDLPKLQCDKSALVTAVINLLDNAYKYTGDQKRVKLHVFASENNVCFQVEDNGIGIAAGKLKKIFNRFYQVDQTLARSAEGCGLGLSIVKFIVEGHGGSVSVQSKPGKGSAFTIKIPVRRTS